MSDAASPPSASGVTLRRKSVAARHATQTLPRGFVMPSSAEAEATPASSSSGSGGGLGLKAAPVTTTNPSIAAAVQRAQAARTSTGGSSGGGDHSPRASSPSSAGGGRRLSTLVKPGDQLKPPVSSDDSAAASGSPRKPRTSLTTTGTPVTISSPPSAAAKFQATKARLSISGRGGTMGRVSFGSRPLDENSVGDDSPGLAGSGAGTTRSRASSSAMFPPSASPQLTPAGRLSVGSKSMTPGHRSTASVSFAASTVYADASAAALPNHHRNSSQMSAVLHPDSLALAAPGVVASGRYTASAFVSERALAAGAQSENITVVVRCRPFIREESARGADTSRKSVSLTSTSVSFVWKGEPKKYTYDQVFGDSSTQRDVYLQAAGSLVHEFIKGFNATMFCYGQTGSGKTHTLFGRGGEGDEQNGIIPRACDHIFSYIASEGGAQGSPNDDDPDAPPALDTSPLGQVSFLLSVSFLEIYNEHVHDLLSFTGSSKLSLDVREDVATGSFQVPNLSKHIVTNRADLLKLIARGGENRSTTSTIMNEGSSRSHSMLTIMLEKSYRKPPPQRNAEDDDDDEFDQRDNAVVIQSKLNLVDLAGSERLTTNAMEKTGKETMAINLSLSTLANVIAALTSEKPNQHVPYRDSKLTRLLKDSLGGNSKTTMIACCNMLEACLPETVSTLRYANRAKNIKNKPKVNQDPKDALLLALKAEIAALKELLLGQSKMALRMFTYVADLAVDDGENELKKDDNGNDAVKALLPAAATTLSVKALMPPGGPSANEDAPSSVTLAPLVPPSPDAGTISSPQAVKPATAPAASKPAAVVRRPAANSDDDSPATSPDTSPESSPKLGPTKEPTTPIPAAVARTTLSSTPSSPVQNGAAPTPAAMPTAEPSSPMPDANLAVVAAVSSPSATGAASSTAVVPVDAVPVSSVSTADLEALPPEEFYSRFKSNVMKLYTLLLANQSDLSIVREQLEHALARLRFHEGDKTLAAVGPVDSSSSSISGVAPVASSVSVAPPSSAPGLLSPDFAPMSPTAVLEEATQRLGDQMSGLVSPKPAATGTPSTAVQAANANAATSVAPSAVPTAAAAPLPPKQLVPPPPPPRPPTLALAPASRRASLARGSTVLYSPRNASGDPSASPATTGGLLTPADLSLESQRVLHLQASLESLRSQLEQKDQRLLSMRAESVKACADVESRMQKALDKVQDELLDRNRRIEDQETELEQHRVNEREWRKILQEHAATVGAGMAGAAGSPCTAASPLSYDLSALSSPGYLAESAAAAAASPKSVSFASPADQDVSSSSPAVGVAAAVSSPPPSLDTFDGRLSYLRSVLHGAAQTATAFPKLVGLLQTSTAQLAQAEQKQRDAEAEIQRLREAEQQRGNPAVTNGSTADGGATGSHPSAATAAAATAPSSSPAASSPLVAALSVSSVSSSSVDLVQLRAAHAAALSEWSVERADLRHQLSLSELAVKSLHEQRQAATGAVMAATAAAVASSAAAAGLAAPSSPSPSGAATDSASSSSSLPLFPPSSGPSSHWLEQTILLQNSIVELSQEIEQLRHSKRELVKHSSQELKRMRIELMRAKGMPIPGEEPPRVQAPAVQTAAKDKDKTCVVQ